MSRLGRTMGIIAVEGYECERCSYKWTPRTIGSNQPIMCPKCKSKLWNEPLK